MSNIDTLIKKLCPDGIPVKKLGEVVKFLNGRAYKKNELLDEGKYPVLRVGNFFTSEKWYYSDLELDEDKYCEKGDLLYAWAASLGPMIWSGEKVIFHYHIWKLIFDESILNKQYLYHFLKNDVDEIYNSLTHSTMPHVSMANMKERLISVPPIEVQLEIVSILDELDMYESSVSDLDKNENLINTPYATYDLRKGLAGELPHNPEDLITKITACSPGEDGKQIWLDALNLFFCKDQKLIDYVQETVGMAAIGKVYQEHMIIAYGGGANGKSTFWNTIFRVLGNYAGKLSAEALTMNCKRNVKPEMAELKGKRLIISSEMEEGMRLNTAVVKQLCSTDEIQAEKKYKDPFSFVPSHTLVLYTNHLPKVGANDDGIWRRLVVIPFNAKITGKSDIKNYADYLFEHAGPAIMSWIIEGAKRAIDKNFHTTLPDVVEAAIQAYREDNDWLGQFLEECCEIDPSYKEKSGELYQAYRAHCMQNGEYIRSTTDFYSSMDKAGYNRIRKNTGVQVVGLKLKEGQDFLE